MARQVLPIAGAIIGAIVAPGVGASYGYVIGASVGESYDGPFVSQAEQLEDADESA